MDSEDLSFRLLLVTPEIDTATDFRTQLESLHPPQHIHVSGSDDDIDQVLETTRAEVVAFVVTAESEAQMGTLLSHVQSTYPERITLMVTDRGDKELVLRCLKREPHAIALTPSSDGDLRKAFQHALRRARDTAPENLGSSREQITNLSWLLEHVATKLDSVAERLRDEEDRAAGQGVAATPKRIKEALLSALGSTNANEAFSEEMLAWLTSESDKPDKH